MEIPFSSESLRLWVIAYGSGGNRIGAVKSVLVWRLEQMLFAQVLHPGQLLFSEH
jgi:hypothetical protein